MLGLYIHVPFCIKKCNYCDFNSFRLNKNEKKIYIEDLKKEMKLYSEKIGKLDGDTTITSVFLGGGTPSILDSDEIIEIFHCIKEYFNIDKHAEITMECNPGTLDVEKLKTMKNLGINRLSIGLQAVQNKHLKYIGRIHNYEEFEKNYRQAIEVGFENINIDLMYCLPNQNEEDWKETLQKVIELNPEHISAYSLILEEGTKLYDMYEKNEFELTDEDTDIKMYNYTIEYLKERGYKQYEISNYAKDGYECKHNILYWKCKHYIGVGPGASGYIGNERYNNVESLEEYHKKLGDGELPIVNKEYLSNKDKIEEKIFMGLRMNEGIKFDDFKNEFNIDFEEKYKTQIEELKSNKLIEELKSNTSIEESLQIEYGLANNELEKEKNEIEKANKELEKAIKNELKNEKQGIKLTQKGREISNSVFVEFME